MTASFVRIGIVLPKVTAYVVLRSAGARYRRKVRMSKAPQQRFKEHALLLVLRQEPARGAQAHRRTDRVHLR